MGEEEPERKESNEEESGNVGLEEDKGEESGGGAKAHCGVTSQETFQFFLFLLFPVCFDSWMKFFCFLGQRKFVDPSLFSLAAGVIIFVLHLFDPSTSMTHAPLSDATPMLTNTLCPARPTKQQTNKSFHSFIFWSR